MKLVKAVLGRHSTADGNSSVRETVPLGTQYEVDIENTGVMVMLNEKTGKQAEYPCIWVKGNGDEGYMPSELFDVSTEEV